MLSLEQTRKNVLVCITPQTNSRRLIDKGSEIAGEEGRLNILHVEKGDNVFADENAGKLLEELFLYGKTKGGTVHFVTGESFFVTLKIFSIQNKISDIVLGEAPDGNLKKSDLKDMVEKDIPGVEVHVLKKQ